MRLVPFWSTIDRYVRLIFWRPQSKRIFTKNNPILMKFRTCMSICLPNFRKMVIKETRIFRTSFWVQFFYHFRLSNIFLKTSKHLLSKNMNVFPQWYFFSLIFNFEKIVIFSILTFEWLLLPIPVLFSKHYDCFRFSKSLNPFLEFFWPLTENMTS